MKRFIMKLNILTSLQKSLKFINIVTSIIQPAAGSRSKETDTNGTTEPESSYSAGKFEVKQFVDDEVLD